MGMESATLTISVIRTRTGRDSDDTDTGNPQEERLFPARTQGKSPVR
ncbi:hypothetical protein HNQ64_001000 [Prosthecobacter dejongeii]|uniref:Uncharacterized protein n=1 Tax=Prosthecobacter dejongeii TaxID=48465 RepID=A0A7W7YIE9_9BACT|nr:hypothetical protein [Prosthecobacter dejongeii]